MRFMFAKFNKIIIKELLSYYYPEGYDTFDDDIHENIVYVAKFNRLDLCKIIYSNTKVFNGCNESINLAAESGNLEIIKYLTRMNVSCTSEAKDNASRSGHLEVLTWLYENRMEGCSLFAITQAASHGRYEVVRFLIQTGLIDDKKILLRANFLQRNKDILVS